MDYAMAYVRIVQDGDVKNAEIVVLGYNYDWDNNGRYQIACARPTYNWAWQNISHGGTDNANFRFYNRIVHSENWGSNSTFNAFPSASANDGRTLWRITARAIEDSDFFWFRLRDTQANNAQAPYNSFHCPVP